MSKNKRILQLEVDEDQVDALKAFFAHWDWGWKEIDGTSEKNTSEQELSQNIEAEVEAQPLVRLPSEEIAAQSNIAEELEEDQLPIIIPAVTFSPAPVRNLHADENSECPHCFCDPCVTTNRQFWLGPGQAPRNGNSTVRKEKYKKFWTVLCRGQAWKDVRYLAKKQRLAGRNNDDRTVWIGNSEREIMPDCVLDLVRSMYPNLPSVPYMGHRWH